jgi:transposase
VIGPTGAVKVMVATRPVDFRKGAEARRADRVKLIFWDGTGLCLYAKRLEEGEFRWPRIENGVMRLTAAQLSALLEGLDWRRVHEARRSRVPVAAG